MASEANVGENPLCHKNNFCKQQETQSSLQQYVSRVISFVNLMTYKGWMIEVSFSTNKPLKF